MNITPVRNDNLLRRFLIDFKTFFNSFPILGHKDNEIIANNLICNAVFYQTDTGINMKDVLDGLHQCVAE